MALEFKILGCQKRKKAKAGFNQMKPKNTKKKRAKFYGNNFAKMSVGGVRKKINPPCNDDVIARNIETSSCNFQTAVVTSTEKCDQTMIEANETKLMQPDKNEIKTKPNSG